MEYYCCSVRSLTWAFVILCVYFIMSLMYVQVPYLKHILVSSREALSYRNHSTYFGSILDIHKEDGFFRSHVGSHVEHDYIAKDNTVAIGCAITSNRIKLNSSNTNVDSILKAFPLFQNLLPSFCETSEKKYEYHFYFAYDINDPFFVKEQNVRLFADSFTEARSRHECDKRSIPTFVHFLQCSHAHKPAWAQNDAMMEAYYDGIEYFYRINDDTILKTLDWTSAFIDALKAFSPPNVGVVGPKHEGGNTQILTYDFVHKTHVDIFGFYYPRIFTDWYADDWITKVYSPGRALKLKDVHLKHTLKLGQRYKTDWSKHKLVPGQIKSDKQVLQSYVVGRADPNFNATKNPNQILSLSLYGTNPVDIQKALRNAQLAATFFPSWEVHIYIPDVGSQFPGSPTLVPTRICHKLQDLGAKLLPVPAHYFMPPKYWNLAALFPSTSVNSTTRHVVVLPVENHILEDGEFLPAKQWINHLNVTTSMGILNSPKSFDNSTVEKLPELPITWGISLNALDINKLKDQLQKYFIVNKSLSSNNEAVNTIIFDNVKNSLLCQNIKTSQKKFISL